MPRFDTMQRRGVRARDEVALQRWCIWLVIGLSLIALACGGDDPPTPAEEGAAHATPAEQGNDAATAPPEQPSGGPAS